MYFNNGVDWIAADYHGAYLKFNIKLDIAEFIYVYIMQNFQLETDTRIQSQPSMRLPIIVQHIELSGFHEYSLFSINQWESSLHMHTLACK